MADEADERKNAALRKRGLEKLLTMHGRMTRSAARETAGRLMKLTPYQFRSTKGPDNDRNDP